MNLNCQSNSISPPRASLLPLLPPITFIPPILLVNLTSRWYGKEPHTRTTTPPPPTNLITPASHTAPTTPTIPSTPNNLLYCKRAQRRVYSRVAILVQDSREEEGGVICVHVKREGLTSMIWSEVNVVVKGLAGRRSLGSCVVLSRERKCNGCFCKWW